METTIIVILAALCAFLGYCAWQFNRHGGDGSRVDHFKDD